MTFADELYKYDLDPYEKEKMFVHNLFIVECIKVAMSKNRQSRQFNWACSYYSEDYGDSYHLLSPDHPTGFLESSYSKYNWSVIKSLIENEVKKGDLGLRNFTITITDESKR